MKGKTTTAEIILLKASITKTNNNGERGSPCPNPLELLKKSFGEPLTRMEKCADEIDCSIQEHHFPLKQLFLDTYNIKSQFT
jgi:hypothetical protein